MSVQWVTLTHYINSPKKCEQEKHSKTRVERFIIVHHQTQPYLTVLLFHSFFVTYNFWVHQVPFFFFFFPISIRYLIHSDLNFPSLVNSFDYALYRHCSVFSTVCCAMTKWCRLNLLLLRFHWNELLLVSALLLEWLLRVTVYNDIHDYIHRI